MNEECCEPRIRSQLEDLIKDVCGSGDGGITVEYVPLKLPEIRCSVCLSVGWLSQ